PWRRPPRARRRRCAFGTILTYFFFQAEDGIRDGHVTGVQTCALPISTEAGRAFRRQIHETIHRVTEDIEHDFHFNTAISAIMERSEERRVGKECRGGCGP